MSPARSFWYSPGNFREGHVNILGFCRSCGEPELFQIPFTSSYKRDRYYVCKCGVDDWWLCRPVPKKPGTDKRCTECTHRFFCGTVDVKQFARRFEMTFYAQLVVTEDQLSTREKKLLAKRSRIKKHGKNTGEAYKNSVLNRKKKIADVA